MSIFTKYDLIDVNERVDIPEKPNDGVTVLVGASGTGKTTIMKAWGMPSVSYDEFTPIYKLFRCEEDAEKLLLMFGLRTIPSWRRSLSELSNGERQRAIFALNYHNGIFFCDEFTSLVDRDTARALCNSINKAKPDRLIVASCHDDILKFLDWDQAYDCASRQWGSLRLRPRATNSIFITINQADSEKAWRVFGKYHYLSSKISKSSTSYVAYIGDRPVAMTSFLAFPSGNWDNGWRGHRTVVLPEFQGLGIGNALSEWVARKITLNGGRYFSKASHPSMGEYRESSDNWRATSKNKVLRKDYKSERKTKEDGHKLKHSERVCYSHEFIGGA
tara:strand:+ start:367 stop:1362 length:996 start_codon:yes stop_codon:yes gene_type:complete